MNKKTKKRWGGDNAVVIKPQTFPPTYPVPPGGTTSNENSAAITKLFADSAANSEYDSMAGVKKGGNRSIKRKSCLKNQRCHKRKTGGYVKWGCMS